MSNADTAAAITINLQKVLEALGIKFAVKTWEDIKSIPASLLPAGEIRYVSEVFEFTNGERPKYATAKFLIKIIFSTENYSEVTRQQQRWIHMVREAATVPALNIGGLAQSKLVSRVDTDSASVNNDALLSILEVSLSVRYREV